MGNHKVFLERVKRMRFLSVSVVFLVTLFILWTIRAEPDGVPSILLKNVKEKTEPKYTSRPASKMHDVLSNKSFPKILEEEKYTRKYAGLVLRQDEETERKERTVRISAPKEAAKNQDWELFITAVDNLHDMPDFILHNTISSAIKNDAPIDVFEKLLERGAVFLGRHTTMLAIYNNLTLMKKLIPLGLDIHGVNYRGDNAINACLVIFSSREMLNFLLEYGVEIQKGTNHIDPLMVALIGAEKNNEASYYAFMLVKYDAEVTSEHLAQVKKLSEINPEAYKLLTTNILEFR